MKSLLNKTIIITCCCIAVTNNIFAAGMGGQGNNPCGGPFDPCPVPLDGGVSLLFVAGAVYGGKKIYDTFKKGE